MEAGDERLTVVTAVTEDEAAESLKAALEMEVHGESERKEVEGGDGTQRELESIEFLTQEAEPSGTTLVDACNGFNKLSRLEIMWTVRHLCPTGARFAFNCYRDWAQLLLCQPGETPVTILSMRGSLRVTLSQWFCMVSP